MEFMSQFLDDLILVAMADEAPSLALRPEVFVMGIGKVNAALVAARLIERFRPRRVWNFGTAGGVTVGSGLHRCTRFVQRDMLVTALGFAAGQTPFEEGIVLDLGGDGLTCSSGDSFVTAEGLDVPADVVDMEAYAVAKACRDAGAEFLCYKFISDGADEGAAGDWRLNIARGEPLYGDVLRSFGWTL
jgi:adenosylhomocysteine nucleosidase